MRIRKCASKLLGATIGYFSPPPPRPKPCSSPAWDSQAASAAAAAAAAAGILCQLNRSPWDLIPNDQNAVSQEDEDADPAADDDDRGAAANRIKPERKPGEPPLIKSDVKIKEEEEKVRKKVKRKRMEKGIDSTVATKTGETTAAPLCKKSDGKGWHCKRPAHLPHSLCHYHLTQLRSYTNNSSYRKVADQATGDGDKHRKKKAAADAAGDGNNFYYYYYSGFGPWRGKRRGGNYSINGDVGEEGGRENSESMDGHDDALVTGDDEEDSEEEEDKSDEEEEEEGNCRKRGRKPVKARSLKSLL